MGSFLPLCSRDAESSEPEPPRGRGPLPQGTSGAVPSEELRAQFLQSPNPRGGGGPFHKELRAQFLQSPNPRGGGGPFHKELRAQFLQSPNPRGGGGPFHKELRAQFLQRNFGRSSFRAERVGVRPRAPL